MCMRASAIRPYQKWNWAGDEILHSPIVPARRPLPGKPRARYEIDIREYLSIATNHVVAKFLGEIEDSLQVPDRLRLHGRKVGDFDFRAHTVSQAMGRLRHIPGNRKDDAWLFPGETIGCGGGDCEDLAFLLAALLLQTGISPTCIRVALGSLTDWSESKPRSWDHAWVVYLREDGAWEILEPLVRVAQGRAAAQRTLERRRKRPRTFGIPAEAKRDIEYTPRFVFNTEHLWKVRTPIAEQGEMLSGYVQSRRFWDGFTPSFAAGVHDEIFDAALVGMDEDDLRAVKGMSLWVDVNTIGYDPRDHFDFAYIPEGWKRVKQRLATGDIGDFALATHAIADFYAHSLYAHVTPPDGPKHIPLCDPAQLPAPDAGTYGFFQNLALPSCDCGWQKARDQWTGKLISGQWWRWYTTYPTDLKDPAELAHRRCLPDHDQLAVDGPKPHGAEHGLYKTPQAYDAQFQMRRTAAIEHIAKVYSGWQRR